MKLKLSLELLCRELMVVSVAAVPAGAVRCDCSVQSRGRSGSPPVSIGSRSHRGRSGARDFMGMVMVKLCALLLLYPRFAREELVWLAEQG